MEGGEPCIPFLIDFFIASVRGGLEIEMNENIIKIMPATVADQKRILELEQTILSDMELAVYQDLTIEQVQTAMLQAAKQDPKSRYHFSQAIVAKDANKTVVGVLFGYPAEQEAGLDLTFQRILAERYDYHELFFPDSEVYENEWYLDSISIDENVRGQGVGSMLLTAMNQFAAQAEAHVIGLNVDDGNPKALQLYERIGFSEVGRLKIGPHQYAHLQRQIKP